MPFKIKMSNTRDTGGGGGILHVLSYTLQAARAASPSLVLLHSCIIQVTQVIDPAKQSWRALQLVESFSNRPARRLHELRSEEALFRQPDPK